MRLHVLRGMKERVDVFGGIARGQGASRMQTVTVVVNDDSVGFLRSGNSQPSPDFPPKADSVFNPCGFARSFCNYLIEQPEVNTKHI